MTRSSVAAWLVSSLTGFVAACTPSGDQGQDSVSGAAGKSSVTAAGTQTGRVYAVASGSAAPPNTAPGLADDIEHEAAEDDGGQVAPGAPPEIVEGVSPPLARAVEGEPAHFIDADQGMVPCAIKRDHTLWCWGQWNYSRPTWQMALYPTQYGSDADWMSVSVSDYSVCGLRGEGSIDCFGYVYDNGEYWIDASPTRVGQTGQWQSLSNGALGGCAIEKDGSLWCWGYLSALTDGAIASSLAPVQIGSDQDWAMVSTNGGRACGIKHDGALLCFGFNYDGGLGDGTTVDRGAPTPVADPGPWLGVATGGRTCGLRADHTLWCWGDRDGATFTRVDENTDWEQVSGHGYTTCGLRGGGKPYCFNLPGWLEALDETGGYTRVSSSCALHSDQTLHCAGPFAAGDGSGPFVPTPVRVGTESDWTALSFGEWHVSGLHADGRIDSYRAPLRPEGSGWREVSTGSHTTCGIRDDGSAWCWGGYFGTNDEQYTSGNLVPVQIGSANDWLHIALAGYGWMCGIRGTSAAEGGSLWCEFAYYGKTVQQVSPYDDWKTVAASYNEGCGVRADGSLWCWKMIPNCGFSAVPQFERVGSDNDWVSAEPGGHLCAIKTDGSLWCRGDNLTGNLGIGAHAASTELVQVAPGTKWRRVVAGSGATCGIKLDGSLWCWGDNRYAELGVGWPGANRTLPERVGSSNDWDEVALSEGWNTVSCGLRRGELWCWGLDLDGLVTRTPPADGLKVVRDAPTPQGDFCLWPNDLDSDGYADCIGDCDDHNADVNPFQDEVCNGIDDNCDGNIDEQACP